MMTCHFVCMGLIFFGLFLMTIDFILFSNAVGNPDSRDVAVTGVMIILFTLIFGFGMWCTWATQRYEIKEIEPTEIVRFKDSLIVKYERSRLEDDTVRIYNADDKDIVIIRKIAYNSYNCRSYFDYDVLGIRSNKVQNVEKSK